MSVSCTRQKLVELVKEIECKSGIACHMTNAVKGVSSRGQQGEIAPFAMGKKAHIFLFFLSFAIIFHYLAPMP